MTARMGQARPLADLTEKQWQTQVVNLARTLGWRKPFHVYDSRRSEPGWPDLTLVRERFVFAELKREKTQLTDAQKSWLTALTTAGVECYVWRPSDLDELGKVLSGRFSFFPAGSSGDLATPALANARTIRWQPDSLLAPRRPPRRPGPGGRVTMHPTTTNERNPMQLYRQGDVVLIPVAEIPRNTKPVNRENGRVILAHGEITGHHHSIVEHDVELVTTEQAGELRAWLSVTTPEPVALVHQEHDTLLIPPGKYEVRRQREYAPEEIRRVQD